MTKHDNKKFSDNHGFIYFLGIIGSMVFFIQQVDGFWMIVLAILKSFVWPAFMIYDIFRFLAV